MKITRITCLLFLLVVSLGTTLSTQPVLAQEEKIELEATYPRIESATPGASFKFTVALRYRGSQARTFDLRAAGPSGWTTYITSNDENIKISAINIGPNKYYPDQVKVITSPPPSTILEPKEYKITLEASSGAITGSIELTAIVTPTYSMDLVLSHNVYYHEVTVGKNNIFSINISNTGSGTLTNIKFSTDKPEGWVIKFRPEKIDSLMSGSSEKIEVNIKPAAKAAAEYYQATLIAEANQTRVTTNMEVFVEKPKGAWIWVGAVIAFLVIAGFTGIFLRLNRRK